MFLRTFIQEEAYPNFKGHDLNNKLISCKKNNNKIARVRLVFRTVRHLVYATLCIIN